MKKLYTLFTCIFILSGINSQGQQACFTYTEFPAGAPHCEGITLIFSDCSVGATSWDWDFGPNAIPQFSNQQFPGLVQFPVCAMLNPVTLTINGGGSANLIQTEYINIWCNPTACFTVSPPAGCAGTLFCFSSSCSQFGAGSNSLSYQWDLGDGSGPTSANPCHIYQDTGCFSVGLIVTNNHGCTDYVSVPSAVCISAPPTFQISSSASTTCLQNLSVDFCAPPISGGSSPYAYNWVFQGGNPATSTLPCPTGIDFTTGQWDVSCTVTDVNGCSTTVTLPNYINVGNNSTSIILTDTAICVGECVTVQTAAASSYSWTINPTTCVTPNTTQTTASVNYCFSCAGDYVITINSVVNGCVVTATATVHVLDTPIPCIAVTSNPPSCSVPQTINVAYCGPTPVAGEQYVWNFPGGAPNQYTGTSTNPNPPNAGAITYYFCGHYSIYLTITNANGCDSTVTLTDTVKIDCPQACYTISDLPGEGQFCAPMTLHFDASCSSGSPTIYKWCVAPVGGPPCVPLSLGPTPALSFNSSGCYNVTLITINAQGCTDTVTNSFTGGPICVGEHMTPCFTPSTSLTCAAIQVQFNNCTLDSNGIAGGPGFPPCVSWCWNWGDSWGCQYALKNSAHLYQDTGCFDVMLVADDCGCSDTLLLQQAVCILPPISHIDYTINCDSPNVVLFNGTNSIGADTYQWNFPGGTPSTSTDSIIYVTYPMPNPNAVHTASLIVCNTMAGCCDTTDVTFFLRDLEAIAIVDTIVCYPQTSEVVNTSIGASIYTWKIYDLCNNGILLPSLNSNARAYSNNTNYGAISWPGPGKYHVWLKVGAINGCTDTVQWDITVHGVYPGFWGAPTLGCAPVTVTFHDTSSASCVSIPTTYSIDWGDSTGASAFVSINQSVTHTYNSNGNFNVTETVMDQWGCISTMTTNNYVTTGLLVSQTHINPSCGSNNGSIDVTVISGTGPYTYLWSNGMTTEDLSLLYAGTYTVTVNDINNCVTDFTVTLVNSNALTISEVHSNASCGNTNGSVNVSINSGTAPFYYSWSNGATTQDIFNLAAGNYSITVIDANACSSTIAVTINNTNAPILSEQHTNSSCGGINGTIDLSVTGGAPTYHYHWNNSATTEDLSNLSAGTYAVTVTDNNNCTAALSVSISYTTNPTVTEAHTNELCNSSNGVIDISVSSGLTPFSYLWSNGVTTQDLNNLSAGNYSVTVTDANNCTATLSITIVNHPAPTITVNHIDASCLNCHDGSATVLISGGTPPYTIQWNTGSTNNPIINIDPGVYQVCVTDANGCSVCDSVTVGYAIGINSITENDFVQIIPNPNNGIFTLYFSSSVKPKQIEVYNLLGEKIYSVPNNEWKQRTQLNLSFLSDGIYFLKIENAQNLIMKKIVISRK